MINVTIPNLKKFQSAFKKYPALSEKAITRAILKSMYEIVIETKPLVPFKKGLLKGSIGEQGQGGIFQVSKMSGMVGSRVKYAVYVHESYNRHPRGGQRKFLEVGAKKALRKINGYFKEEIDDVFNKISKDSK